ncbi:MAG TPA: hypothetical protein DD422_05525 [Akkermansia sp.]|uniref:hypothetical protein n=2 Tax=uncultured Akkermansia sp. TaxID=512294 RepID=UPI000E82C250|nr:hypothetical protein [uncultured Akkermansia sp.]HBN17490.1 hypothetical protein [Akkermansia sp.]
MEGLGEGDGRDGADEGREDGLPGALTEWGGEEGLETEEGLPGRLTPECPGLWEEGLEAGGEEGRLGRPKSGLEGRLTSGRLMPGRFEPPGREG